MSTHKLFRQLFELPDEENYDVRELLEMVSSARIDFKNVGKEFTYEGFKEWFNRAYAINSSPSQTALYYAKLLKIIEGDNLDIIEEAAEDKGLI